jgi:hypothetical protein
MSTSIHVSKQRLAALEQDKAAGGLKARRIRTKTGGLVVASVAAVANGNIWRTTLRFKWGGSNVQRPIGSVEAGSRAEALRLAWELVRRNQVVEQNGWTWEFIDGQ